MTGCCEETSRSSSQAATYKRSLTMQCVCATLD